MAEKHPIPKKSYFEQDAFLPREHFQIDLTVLSFINLYEYSSLEKLPTKGKPSH